MQALVLTEQRQRVTAQPYPRRQCVTFGAISTAGIPPPPDRKFADSPLERDGFEPSVPRRKRRGAYRRYKDLLVRRGTLERWYDFYNNAEEGFAGVVRGETCLRSCTRSRMRASSSSRRIRRALLAGAAFDYQNAREGMDRDRRQQWPSAWGCAGACRASRCQGSL